MCNAALTALVTFLYEVHRSMSWFNRCKPPLMVASLCLCLTQVCMCVCVLDSSTRLPLQLGVQETQVQAIPDSNKAAFAGSGAGHPGATKS